MKSKLASEQVSKRERDLERKNGQGETERENPLSLRVGFWGRFWEGNTGGWRETESSQDSILGSNTYSLLCF